MASTIWKLRSTTWATDTRTPVPSISRMAACRVARSMAWRLEAVARSPLASRWMRWTSTARSWARIRSRNRARTTPASRVAPTERTRRSGRGSVMTSHTIRPGETSRPAASKAMRLAVRMWAWPENGSYSWLSDG